MGLLWLISIYLCGGPQQVDHLDPGIELVFPFLRVTVDLEVERAAVRQFNPQLLPLSIVDRDLEEAQGE